MSNLPIFSHPSFGTVRVVEHEGEPWFVASDVAKALGYEKPNNAVNEHCKKVNKFSYPNSGQLQPYNIIPESDVYRLVMRSNLPGAVEFQDWVVEEILPSIRKHGLYATEEVVDRILDDPDFGITLLQRYKFEREQRQLAESQRDEAIRTKAWISDKKTATAMATASVAVRKAAALEDELGRGKRYKSVKAIPWLLTEFVESRGMYSVVGKALKRMSTDLGYSIEKIATPEYPEGINAYHVDVISAFRCELAQNPGMLDRYRKRRAA